MTGPLTRTMRHVSLHLSVVAPEDGEEHEACARMLQSECIDQFPADRNGTRRFNMTLLWTIALLPPPRRPEGTRALDRLELEFDEAVGWFRREPGVDTEAALALAARNISEARAEATLCMQGDCAKMTGRARPCPIHG